jgi:putative ABC transport system permease protein
LALGAATAGTFGSIEVLGGRAMGDQMSGDRATTVMVQAGPPFAQAGVGLDPDVVAQVGVVAGGEPSLRTRAVLHTPEGERLVVGVNPESDLARDLVGGDRGEAGAARVLRAMGGDRVALSTVAAGRLGVAAGSRVDLPTVDGTRSFTVAGTFEPALVDDSSVGDWVLADVSTAERRWAAVPVQVSLSFDDQAAASAARARIVAAGLTVEAFDRPAWEAAAGSAWARYFHPFVVTGAVVMAAGALATLNLLLLGLVQRRRERAVLRAIGLDVQSERGSLLLQGGLLAVCATLAGIAATHLMVWLLTEASPVYYGFRLTWGVAWGPIAKTAALVAGLAVAGAALPALRAGRLRVAEALTDE